MDIGYSSWNAPAAYLYLLGLDAVSLAWEYLRRNASYQSHWQGVATGPADSCATERWGLRHLEDPRRDGRIADPLWHPTPRSFVWLTRYTEDDVSARFQFWRIPGDKTLVHDGARLRLTARRVRAVTRAMLAPDLVVDESFAFCIPAGSQIAARCKAAEEFAAATVTDPLTVPSTHVSRPTRSALTHMRSLQALDGARAGASQREIATAIFGRGAVHDQWAPDSELRAQTRYLLRRGTALAGGGYRDLLHAERS